MSMVKRIQDVTSEKIMKIVAMIAFALAVLGANQMCMYWYHQPVMPEQVRMLKSKKD